MRRLSICIFLIALASSPPTMADADQIVVGSKKFTESVILGEMATQLAREVGAVAVHKRELGGTRVLFNALVNGDIHVYAEYTGTISHEILKQLELVDQEQVERALWNREIRMTKPLGFNNTYAIGMKPEMADRLGIRTLSEMRVHPDLRLGFTNEFMDRGDGWPALRSRYKLPQQNVRGLDHDIALRALSDGDIDATDLYSTDAEIAYYGFRVLEDDLSHFPRYDALFLYHVDLERRAPQFVQSLRELSGTIDETRMISMNKRVKIDRKSESAVAASYLGEQFELEVEVIEETFVQRHMKWLNAHLYMLGVAMAMAIPVAISLGILAAKFTRIEQIIVGAVGIFQTIPALALLVFMMALTLPGIGRLGIGAPPAIAALFLYGLLPIVRNTHTGLRNIDLPIQESAAALGLSSWSKLTKIELPLASRTILAGIKTAAVIIVGFATLGALIGAGGYGEPILTGIRLDDKGLILEGAVGAALLALLVQGVFELIERCLVPRGLRLKPTG